MIEHLYRQGERLAAGLREVADRHGLSRTTSARSASRATCCSRTLDPDGRPSQAFRTLFLQETIAPRRAHAVAGRQLLATPTTTSTARSRRSTVRSQVYAKALDDGTERYLVGRPSRQVFDRRWK